MHSLSMKNKQTGKCDNIDMQDLVKDAWGFRFLVDTELDAYKAAYLYRTSKHGVKVDYAPGASKWMVTVFNQFGADMGFNR